MFRSHANATPREPSATVGNVVDIQDKAHPDSRPVIEPFAVCPSSQLNNDRASSPHKGERTTENRNGNLESSLFFSPLVLTFLSLTLQN